MKNELTFPKPQKRKKSSRKSLVAKLDKIISEIVRLRDKKCVTCKSDQQLGAGHILSRSHYSTRWSLKNVWCQCWPCNFRYKNSDTVFYILWYQDKFGRKAMGKLYDEWKAIKKYSNSNLTELYEKLQQTKLDFANKYGII